jgi:hypothetical protein
LFSNWIFWGPYFGLSVQAPRNDEMFLNKNRIPFEKLDEPRLKKRKKKSWRPCRIPLIGYSRQNLAISAAACSGGSFVVSRAGETYDAQARVQIGNPDLVAKVVCLAPAAQPSNVDLYPQIDSYQRRSLLRTKPSQSAFATWLF